MTTIPTPPRLGSSTERGGVNSQTNTNKHKPHMSKYNQEQINMVMDGAKRFTNQYGQVSWERMVVEAPEIIAMAGTLKRVQQLYRRQLNKNGVQSNKAMPWSKEDLTHLITVAETHRDSRGRINWEEAKQDGSLATILATRSFKNVKDRYFYEVRYKGKYKHKYTPKVRAGKIGQQFAQPKPEPEDDYADLIAPEVAAAREAELARQARVAGGIPATAGKIGYCPFCGNNISAILSLNLQ